MSFRKRRSRNPSSSRASNKIRVTSNKRFAELESIVDFASENESDDIQFMNIPHLNNKEESKESYDVISDKLKKRDIKLLNKEVLKNNCFQNSESFLMECYQRWMNKINS